MAREASGDATGLDLQANATGPNAGLTASVTAGEASGSGIGPFVDSDNVINFSALGGDVTATVIGVNTEHQPFAHLIESDATVTGAAANLGLSVLGVPINLVTLSADAIDSAASVSGSCGAFTANATSSVENLNLSVLGQTVATNLSTTSTPNNELLNTTIDVNLGLVSVSAQVLVILNEQTIAGDQSSATVNALRVSVLADIDAALGGDLLTQELGLVISQSQAAFTNCNDVDLSVDKTTNLSGDATVNTPFNYTVTITETSGNGPATAVEFTDTLPPEVTFLNFVSTDGGDCSHLSGTVHCQWLSIPANGSVAVTYRVNPNTVTAPGSADNAVVISTADNDTDNSDDSDSVSVVIDDPVTPATDLTASFTGGTPADGTAGTPQNVSIQVTNTGTTTTGTELVYSVTPGASIDNLTGTAVDSCTGFGTDTVVCALNDLPDGFDATFTATVTPGSVGNNTHTVTVTSDVADDTPGNNTDQAIVDVAAPVIDVDLQATISDSPDPVTVGNPVTYTIVLSNDGTDPATNVTLDASLLGVPVTIDSAVPDQGSCMIAGAQLSCTLGTLNGGADTIITVVATPGDVGTLQFTGSADDSAGNSAPVGVSTTVNASGADLGITKVVSTDLAALGEEFVYTLTATNQGPEAATSVMISDTLPATVTPVSVDPASSCTVVGNQVDCNLGSLGVGQSVVVSIVVEAVAVGSANNVATVSGAPTDPVPDDNESVPTDTTINAPVLNVDLQGPTTAFVDQAVQYVAVITNTTTIPASELLLDIDLPTTLTVDSIDDAAGGSCTIGSINCTGLAVPANDSIAVVFTVTPTVEGVELLEALLSSPTMGNLDRDDLELLVIAQGRPVQIPTLGRYAMLMVGLLLVLVAWRFAGSPAATRR